MQFAGLRFPEHHIGKNDQSWDFWKPSLLQLAAPAQEPKRSQHEGFAMERRDFWCDEGKSPLGIFRFAREYPALWDFGRFPVGLELVVRPENQLL